MWKQAKSVIFGLKGTVLSEEEKAFFQQNRPFGFILFQRNCDNPTQLKALTQSLRDCVGWHAPILIDQEGGRVARLRPPHWTEQKPAQYFGDLYQTDPVQALKDLKETILSIATELKEAGINVNCAPVLDVLQPQTHGIIGNRAFSNAPDIVSILGTAAVEYWLEAGIMPVIKHIPGHGAACVDTHIALAQVDDSVDKLLSIDGAPFRAVSNIPLWGMSAHVIYTALDPKYPASLSPFILQDYCRKNLGLDILIMSDDLSMHALDTIADIGERASLSIQAGSDLVLHCNGDMNEMIAIAAQIPALSDRAQRLYAQNMHDYPHILSA